MQIPAAIPTTARLTAALVLLSLGIACADAAAPQSPTSPSATAAPPAAAPPPSGVAQIAGDWRGRSGFEQENNAVFYSDLAGSVTQSDRAVQGRFTFTSAGWETWSATFSGTLAGSAPDTQFVGSVEYRAPSSTGTGSCVGQAIFAGRANATALLWETPELTMTNTAPLSPAHSCRGLLRKLALVLQR
jgi:hypothetical protein